MKLKDFKFRAYEAGKRISKRDLALNLLEHFHYDSEVPYLDEDTRQIELFTGLYDKNGKEIYEGDILKATNSYEGKELEIIGVVEYESRGGFYHLVDGKKNYSKLLFGFNSLEIIGNIHENAELLKE